MAYVKFYRGLEASLLANVTPSAANEGAFYLTTDTERLYNVVNKGTTAAPDYKMVPLGERINLIQELNALPNAAEHIGEFAYVANGNIFAVSVTDGSSAKWQQVNQQAADLSVQSLTTAVAAANDTATITLTANKNGGAKPDTTLKIAAGTGIDVTSSANDTVTISKEATPLRLNPDSGDVHTLAVDGGKVKLVAGTAITLEDSAANGTITITGDQGGVSAVDVAPVASNGNGFKVTVTGANGQGANDTIDPTITLGNNSSTNYHFVNGNMNLPVYTKEEIDNSLTGLNAMVYKGTIGATNGTTTAVPTTTAPASGATDTRPQIGDTYKVVDEISVVTSNGTVKAEPGDLIIARGTEGPSGRIESGLVWDIVRGADDVDTTYNFGAVTNGVELVAKGGGKAGKLVVNGDDTYITVSDSASNENKDNTLTVSHNTITQAADVVATAVTQTKGSNATYKAVSDVFVDGAGHVTGVETKELTVTDTTLKSGTLAVTAPVTLSNSIVTVTPTVHVEDTAGVVLQDNATFSLSSTGSTIEMSVNTSTNNINADIVWGTF